MAAPAPYPTYVPPGQSQAPPKTGPQTRDEWIATHAITWQLDWANNIDTPFGNPFFANQVFDARGLTHIYQPGKGSDVLDPLTYSTFSQAAAWAFDNWDKLSPEERAGFLNPTTATGQKLPSTPWVDPSLAISSYTAESDRIRAEAYAQAQNAQAAAAIMGAQAEFAKIAAQQGIAQLQADVDREAIASRERMSALDRAESMRQFDADLGFRREQLAENRRQFDVTIAEDRRQFNASMLFNLLKTGAEIARQPVDWVAHQFYMANMGIPLGALETTIAAQILGAIPPSGPSAAGPVVGGPAAMDGDTQLAEAFGVQPGFVSVSEAVAANPGAGGIPGLETLTAGATAQSIIEQFGSMEMLDSALAEARAAELPAAIGDNPIVQQAVQPAPVVAPEPQTALPQLAPSTSAAQPGVGVESPSTATPTPLPDIAPQPQAPVSAFGTSTAGATASEGPYTGGPLEAQQMQATAAPATPTAPPVGNPQGEALLAALANELGVPIEQVRQLIPPHLLAQGYSVETLKQMPVIQALQQGADRTGAEFRTAPVAEGDRFATITAFGIPLGIRSGQDVNAGLMLKSNPVNQQMMRGAIEGAGLDWNTTVNQSLRASPVGPWDVTAFGRRRFG